MCALNLFGACQPEVRADHCGSSFRRNIPKIAGCSLPQRGPLQPGCDPPDRMQHTEIERLDDAVRRDIMATNHLASEPRKLLRPRRILRRTGKALQFDVEAAVQGQYLV